MNPKTIARTALTFLGSGYHRLRATKPVWLALNREARRRYAEHPATLLPREAQAVASLREEGISVAYMADFFKPDVLDELERYVRNRRASANVESAIARHRAILAGEVPGQGVKKAFLVNLWDGEPVLDLSHPFIRFSLSEPILKIVNAYLGMFSKFRGWRLEVTIPTPPERGRKASQRWHRDEEDRRLVKVFLYLNDVDAAAGPFMYVRRSQVGGKWGDLFPMVPPRGSLPMPPNVDDFIPEADTVVCRGRLGTLIFCDTTGLHQGGFSSQGERFMYTSIYTSSASPWPIRYTYPSTSLGASPLASLPGAEILSPAARHAIENNPNQREPRFYR